MTLAHPVDLPDPGGYLMRCDRVDFPPGGIAYTHVHRGPGIRCLLAGASGLRCTAKPHDIAPGGAWFEAGPDPVLAIASKTAPTAFARVMILPRELRGKSSIRYVKPEDAASPSCRPTAFSSTSSSKFSEEVCLKSPSRRRGPRLDHSVPDTRLLGNDAGHECGVYFVTTKWNLICFTLRRQG